MIFFGRIYIGISEQPKTVAILKSLLYLKKIPTLRIKSVILLFLKYSDPTQFKYKAKLCFLKMQHWESLYFYDLEDSLNRHSFPFSKY